jgi:hypothetical protein
MASVRSMMSAAKQFPNNLHIPIETRFLFCRYPTDRRLKDNAVTKDVRRVFVENYGSCSLSSADLMNCSSVSLYFGSFYQIYLF